VSVSNKAAISLIIAIILFAVFTVLAYTGLFDLVEAKFYNPSIIRAVNREIDRDTGTIQDFLRELQNRFSATLKEPAVQRSFLPNQSSADIFERSRLYGALLDTQSGLQGVRFIDAGGGRIHYSTNSSDILKQGADFVSYRNYNSGADEISFDSVASPGGGNPRIILDDKGERLIFSMPFYDSFDIYRGTALFYLSLRAVSVRLINEGRINIGEDVSIIQSPAGIILGLPAIGKETLIPIIASIWRLQLLNLTPLELEETGASLALISSRTEQGIYIGRLVDEDLFSFPLVMRILLLAAFFCTAYLTIFLVFNFRQDAMTIVRTRIKNLQSTLIEEYHNRKGPADWNRWGRELEQRREEVRREIKRDIKLLRRKPLDKEIDAYINNAWTELVAVIRSSTEPLIPVLDEVQLEEIVHRVLRAAGGNLVPGGQAIMENQTHRDTAAGTPVLKGRRPGASGGRIIEFTRNPALKERVMAEENVNSDEDLEELEEVEELEELEELGGLEELEEPAAAAGKARPSGNRPPSGDEIAALASEIEFTPSSSDESDSAGESLADFEIVSPFPSMLSDLDGKPVLEEDAAPVKTSKLEMLDGNYQMSLVYRPFTMGKSFPPPYLPSAELVVKARNGVNYINNAALKNEAKIPLDKDFQLLVNSVLQR
jgi:hypothetical protein